MAAFLAVLLLAWICPQAINAELVDVFVAGEGGYYCIKIPSLSVTKRGTLIAMGEGRFHNCSDYTKTDLVFKRSTDNGTTWSALGVVHSDAGTAVIGNAAPVVLPSNRIVVPFCRNNLDVFVTYSDDDGVSWTTPLAVPSATRSSWKWIGTGPPASLLLRSGRIVVPAYHDYYPHWDDGELSHGHVVYSDDNGTTWAIGGVLSDEHLSNECQAVQLRNGSVVLFARGALSYRLASLSNDEGLHFDAMRTISLREPLEGCEGSTITLPNGWLLYSGPTSYTSVLRFNMTVFVSRDEGATWAILAVVDQGPSAYSSLALMPGSATTVGLLYERAPPPPRLIFVPHAISFTTVNFASEE